LVKASVAISVNIIACFKIYVFSLLNNNIVLITSRWWRYYISQRFQQTVSQVFWFAPLFAAHKTNLPCTTINLWNLILIIWQTCV